MVSNSDLQKWQQAVEGISAAQNQLSPEELSAFQTLVELMNNDNFEAGESGGHIQIMMNAVQRHGKNRLLKVHLTNFVSLCENYFKVNVVVNTTRSREAKSQLPKTEVNKIDNNDQKRPSITDQIKSVWETIKSASVSIKTVIPKGVVVKAIIATGIIVAGIVLFFIISKISRNSGDASLIPVSSNGDKWGYVNRKGEFVINPQFNNADLFSEGLAKVESNDGKTGYINKTGAYVIPATYKAGTSFQEGLAFVVAEGGYPICIDKTGNTKFELNVEYVSAFSEGLAKIITLDNKHGFIDKTGKIAIEAEFDLVMPFEGGYARIWQNGKVGFIDKTGKITINPQFSYVENFSEGKAAFQDSEQWGFINTKGAYVINPQFDRASQFSNGLAVIKQGNTYGYIDKTGKIVINSQFAGASEFSDGLAAVKKGDKFGYINKNGKFEINPQFENAGDFFDGIAPVRSANKWGFINKKGQYVINPQFQKFDFVSVANILFNDYVESDFYDTSEFINLLFERETGSTFDGISSTTTLKELSNHPIYGADINARDATYADYRKRIKITNDINISNVLFRFNTTPIYKMVETYNNRGYRTSSKKEYNFNATPDAIVYDLYLTGTANEKQNIVLNALKAEIERRQGQMMSSVGEDKKKYCLIQDKGKLSFAIDNSTYSLVKLYVAFNNEYLSSQFQ